ncbi:MAG TPA: hypothetical protein VFI25_09370 [Planctomycetota bacterium]|jgi:hypothetical protein|nr:hypothetical protein [Planctomycetota bacterium]
MGILHGAMVANLVPVIAARWREPTALAANPTPISDAIRWSLAAMAIGVFASGLRDLYAACGLPGGGWPWSKPEGNREAAAVEARA